jgi:hypothetical protein
MALKNIQGFILDELGRIHGEVDNGKKMMYEKPYESHDGNPFWDTIQGRDSLMNAFPNVDQYRKNFNENKVIRPERHQVYPKSKLEELKRLMEMYGTNNLQSI